MENLPPRVTMPIVTEGSKLFINPFPLWIYNPQVILLTTICMLFFKQVCQPFQCHYTLTENIIHMYGFRYSLQNDDAQSRAFLKLHNPISNLLVNMSQAPHHAAYLKI